MKAYEIQGSFGLDNLKLADRPDTKPEPGKVLIRVKAVSLNYRDLMTVEGSYNPRQPLPLVPCSDGAGKVIDVGEGVTRVKKGDRVVGIFAQRWLAGKADARTARSTLGGPRDGMLREYAILDEEGVVPFPEHLKYEEAATLPCAGLTAWHALLEGNPVKPGDTVLLLGTGGVSIFALQFAIIAGARTIITSSSDEKLNRALHLGAWRGINYVEIPDWDREVMKLTEKEGVDRVVEVGGAGTFGKSLSCSRFGGSVEMIGVLSGVEAPVSVIPILMKGITVRGVFVGSREMLESMCRAVSFNGMKPIIGRVFGFEEAVEAFRLMKSGGHFGKIVIKLE